MEGPHNTHTTVLNALKCEKETFWIEHQHLLPDQIENLWVSRTTSLGYELSSLLGPAAPTQQLDLTLENTTLQALHMANLSMGLIPDITSVPLVWSLSPLLHLRN